LPNLHPFDGTPNPANPSNLLRSFLYRSSPGVNLDPGRSGFSNLVMEHIDLEETRRESETGVWPQYRHISGTGVGGQAAILDSFEAFSDRNKAPERSK